jgi:hypothetical protein
LRSQPSNSASLKLGPGIPTPHLRVWTGTVSTVKTSTPKTGRLRHDVRFGSKIGSPHS